MDIDRFFTLGPELRFQAHDVFTDREPFIAAFHQRILLLDCKSIRSAPDLMDFQRSTDNLLAFVGDGGLGKSMLLRELVRLATDGKLQGLPDSCAGAVVDFADAASRSFETVLLRVRAALGRLGGTWSAFDLALSVYWERKHPGESLTAFLKKTTTLGAAGEDVADQITNTVDSLFAGGLGLVGLGVHLAQLAGQVGGRAITLRRIRRDLSAFDVVLAEQDPDRMLGYMPLLLAYDLEHHRAKTPTSVVVALDTFEEVQAGPSERGGLEDLIARLVYLLPNMLFLVGSRRLLTWADPARSFGLTYGGTARWPGLVNNPYPVDQLQLDGFDSATADLYLRTKLIRDEQPAIPADIRHRIIDGAAGSPLYLQLSAALFEQIAARGEDPRPDLFGLPFPELVLRTMRDLDETDRDLLRAAALLFAFDTGLLLAVLPQVRQRRLEEFTRRSFVHHEPGMWPPFRLHENLRTSVTSCDSYTSDGWTDIERRDAVLRVTTYLEDVALALWSEHTDTATIPVSELSRRSISAFLLCHRAAVEHDVLPARLGHLIGTLHELGHWQVLRSVPEAEASRPIPALSEVGRLAAGSISAFRPRFERMEHIAKVLRNGPYETLAGVLLGQLALILGDLDTAERYFALGAEEVAPIGSVALLGLAGCALRRSRFAEHRDYANRLGDSRLDRIRATDTLGHLNMHNAHFDKAADLFTATLADARAAGAPLWIARATRHLVLTYMWLDPDRASAVLPEARDLSIAMNDAIGLAQCDMATALILAHRGRPDDANHALVAARDDLIRASAHFEPLPVAPLQILIDVARGRVTEALEGTRRLIDRPPVGPPCWLAIAALWVDRPAWYDFDSLDWLDPATARQRWRKPLARLRVTLSATSEGR